MHRAGRYLPAEDGLRSLGSSGRPELQPSHRGAEVRTAEGFRVAPWGLRVEGVEGIRGWMTPLTFLRVNPE